MNYLAWCRPKNAFGIADPLDLSAANSAFDAGPVETGWPDTPHAPPPPIKGEAIDGYLDRVLVGASWGKSGFNLDDPSTWSAALKGLANALSIVASAFGLVGAGQFVYLLDAASGDASPQTLANALKADWDNFQNAEALATAVKNGDWETVWNAVTSSGKDLTGLLSAWNGGPAPDVNGELTIYSQAPHMNPIQEARGARGQVVTGNIKMVNDMVAAAKSALPNKPTSTAIVKVPQKVSVITGAMPLMTGAGGAAVGFAMLGPVGALVGGAIGAAVGMAAKSKMTTAKAP